MKDSLKITTYDIARELGISQSTVSRALNNSPLISQDVKEKILIKAKEKGYLCNHLAKSLITGKSGSIGILASGFQVDITGVKIIAIDDEIRRNGLHPHIAYTRSESELSVAKAIELITRGIDGLILLSPNILNEKDILNYQKLIELKKPLVIITDNKLSLKCGQVIQTFDKAYENACFHLVDNKCEDIFVFWKNEPLPEALKDQRFEAIIKYLKYSSRYTPQNILLIAESIFHPALNYKSDAICKNQSAKIETLLKRNSGRTGIICHNDMIAMQVLATALKLGMKIPDELMITGYNNSSVSVYANPQLSTVASQPEELAKVALELLCEQIRDSELHERTAMVPCRFIHRET